MNTCVYHLKPTDMVGEILKPLNTLKNEAPNVYETKVKKYDGREFLLERRIPVLDCLWNDVVHMSPVPPDEWKQVLLEAGMQDKKYTFYKIDCSELNQSNLAIYWFKRVERFRKDMSPDEFTAFSPESLETIRTVPQASRDYFKDTYDSGAKPLLFLGIPHILYKGEIDVSRAETITI